MANRQVPNVPSNLDPQLRNFLSALREVANNNASTVNAIFDGATINPTALQEALPNVASIMGWMLSDAPPPLPSGLTITGLFSNIFLYWDNPSSSSYVNHSFTEIWRAEAIKTVTAGAFVVGVSYTIKAVGTTDFTAIGAASNAIGVTFTTTGVGTGTGTAETIIPVDDIDFSVDAKIISTSEGTIHVDSVEPGSQYYYWIRHISMANVAGPYNQSDGTLGSTSLDVDAVMGAKGWTIAVERLLAVAAWIGEADILDAAVTNAKISGTFQSDNYDGSTTGWQLDKTGGTVNLNQLTVHDAAGNVILSSGTGVPWGAIYNKTGFAAISQITAANISTYIASAAIKYAQIGDAEVGTLKIAGEAVTVPAGSSGIGTASVVVNSGGYPVIIIAQAIGANNAPAGGYASSTATLSDSITGALATSSGWSFRPYDGGSYNTPINISPPCILHKFTPSSGNHTYTLSVDTGTLCTILVLGVKR